MRKSMVVLFAAVLVAAFAVPAMADISFFGTARVLPTYYSNFDFDDNLPDAPTLNEGGYTMGEHIRSELRLGWKAGGDNWKIMMIAESDVIFEKDTADRSFYNTGTKGSPAAANAGGEFGIERVELNYTFAPALVLSTGWNIRAADIKTGGLLFGDDHPFIELGGKLTQNLQYALTYLAINNRQLTSGVSPVADDWRVYMLKLNAIVGSGDVKFDLSPMVLYSDNRLRNAEVYYYGIEGTGQIGMIKPSFEFVVADGEIQTTPTKDIKSMAAFAGVELAVSKAFNPYIAFRYAKGDDNDDPSNNKAEGFVGITDIARFTPLIGMDGNILGEAMGNPYSNALYSYSPERKFSTNLYGGISDLGSGDNPGQKLLAFGAKGAISEPLSYKAQVFMIWYDKVENISVGTGKTISQVDKYAGTTFDLQVAYKFSNNFSTNFIYSTFVPGDGIKDQLATTADDTPAMLASLGLVWTY